MKLRLAFAGSLTGSNKHLDRIVQNICPKKLTMRTQNCFPFIVAFVLFFSSGVFASVNWTTQNSNVKVRLRGVSAVSGKVAWASGDKGTFTRTIDGGETWRPGVVPGAEDLDFRDVDAFSDRVAYLLSIGPGEKSRIYKTIDGGANWILQFKNPNQKAFFDAMAFWDERNGVALSDPVDGHFIVLRTSDGGATWRLLPSNKMPAAIEGEGAFAASGTCITVEGTQNIWFGTGGPRARVFRSNDGGNSWQVSDTPLTTGKAAGVFSLVFRNATNGIAVGGDYTKEKEVGENVAITKDGGKTWQSLAREHPQGYRSAVALIHGLEILIAVGPSGTDSSITGGNSWVQMGTDGFHAASFAPTASVGWAVGENGRIACSQVFNNQ